MRNEPAKAVTAAVSLKDAIERLNRERVDPEMPVAAYVDVLARLRDVTRSAASALRTEGRLAGDVLASAVISTPGEGDKLALPEAATAIRATFGRAAIHYGAASEQLHAAWRDVRAFSRRSGTDTDPGWSRFAGLAKVAADAADTLDDVLAGTTRRDGEDAGPLIGGHWAIATSLAEGTGYLRFACLKVRGAVSVSGVLDPEARKTLTRITEPAYSAGRSVRESKTKLDDAARVLSEALRIRRVLTGSGAS